MPDDEMAPVQETATDTGDVLAETPFEAGRRAEGMRAPESPLAETVEAHR